MHSFLLFVNPSAWIAVLFIFYIIQIKLNIVSIVCAKLIELFKLLLRMVLLWVMCYVCQNVTIVVCS
jgi:hypothetical protein